MLLSMRSSIQSNTAKMSHWDNNLKMLISSINLKVTGDLDKNHFCS